MFLFQANFGQLHLTYIFKKQQYTKKTFKGEWYGLMVTFKGCQSGGPGFKSRQRRNFSNLIFFYI